MITVLSSDPGITNYGIAIMSVCNTSNVITYDIKYCGMLRNPIKDLLASNLSINLYEYMKEMRKYCLQYTPNHIVAERFMNRGVRQATGEKVNIMLGALMFYALVNKFQFKMHTASSWKVKLNKVLNMKIFVSKARDQGVTNHELDAACIGLYHACKEFDADFCTCLNSLPKQMVFISRLRKAQ